MSVSLLTKHVHVSRKVPIPRGRFEGSSRSEIWPASRQYCCRGACRISTRFEHLTHILVSTRLREIYDKTFLSDIETIRRTMPKYDLRWCYCSLETGGHNSFRVGLYAVTIGIYMIQDETRTCEPPTSLLTYNVRLFSLQWFDNRSIPGTKETWTKC